MTPEEKQLHKGVYNGIASNIDDNYINDNSVRKCGSQSSAVAEEHVKQKIWDDDVSLEAVERANKNMHEELSGLTLICNAIENLQRRVAELEKDKESSIGRLSGYPVESDDKGIDFFAGLKDKVSPKDKDESKESDKCNEEDSNMGRPFCKVVKGKMLKQDLFGGVDINEYKFPKSATYRIDYMHFFRNMHRWGSFDGFGVELSSSNRPIQGERALLCLGNIDFAVVTIKSYDLKDSIYFVNVTDVRLIPSFFKLGKIFGAKTYPEFMDAIEVTRVEL